MRYGLILSLLVALPCWGQTTTTGKAESTGPCSPAVTGNENMFTINCGIGRAQGQKLLNILNKILANQLDPNVVMTKLDEIHNDIRHIRSHQGWPELTAEEIRILKDRLAGLPRQTVMIVLSNPDNNKSLLAGQLEEAIQGANWDTKQGANMFLGPPARGIYVTAKNKSPAAISLFNALVEIFGKAVVGGLRIDTKMTDRDISVGICDSPLPTN